MRDVLWCVVLCCVVSAHGGCVLFFSKNNIRKIEMDDSVAKGSPFSCVMLLAVHGAVFVDVPLSLSSLESKSNLRAMALSDISRDGRGRGRGSGIGTVVSLVSPSNLGYSNMNSENAQFPNHPQVFIQIIESMSSSRGGMNEEVLSGIFNLYEDRLYSFFRKGTAETRRKHEERWMARAPPDRETLDFKNKFLTFHPDEMPGHDFDARMQVTRDALGLRWRPHQYAIGNKQYCPGGHANQCCLYFPGVDGPLRERLESKLFEFKKEHSKSPPPPLFDDLYLTFHSNEPCVLTIVFKNDTTNGAYCKNCLWRGVSLAVFFQQVGELLSLIFHGVDGFSVEGLMSRTCVVDAACSDFSVPGKGVSIVGFNKEKATATATGNVSALLDVYHRSEEHLGFWEYWIRHNQADVARTSGAGAAAGAAAAAEVPRRFNHRVDVPRELEDFVPACLTCLDSTIQNIEPVFDSHGNVVRVVYTYSDERTEVVDYVPRERPDVPTESMQAVEGSPGGVAARAADLYDHGDDHGDDAQSVSPTRRRRRRRIDEEDDDDGDGDGDGDDGDGDDGDGDDVVEEVDGGRRRRRRTLKKKCMKKCKTKRQQRQQRRLRRCKMTRRMVAKGRGRRRTCVRRL